MPNPEDYEVIEVPTNGNDPDIQNEEPENPEYPVENPNVPEVPNETPIISDDVNNNKITFELMREQANKAFALLGNERPLDTWENVRDVLFEYAKVKYKMTKPIVLEALVDRMIKDEAGIQQDTMYNVSATYARANNLAVDSSYDGRAIAKP